MCLFGAATQQCSCSTMDHSEVGKNNMCFAPLVFGGWSEKAVKAETILSREEVYATITHLACFVGGALRTSGNKQDLACSRCYEPSMLLNEIFRSLEYIAVVCAQY
jgi:hypothetical protein